MDNEVTLETISMQLDGLQIELDALRREIADLAALVANLGTDMERTARALGQLGGAVMPFSAEQKCEEAQREVEMRERVYGRKGKLTPTDEKRIAIMREIADEYKQAAERHRLL